MTSHRATAQQALNDLKNAVEAFVKQHPGTTSATITHSLGLESDLLGSQKNYLAWSILGILVNEKRVRTEKEGHSRLFYPLDDEDRSLR